jgi:hypothetical protein
LNVALLQIELDASSPARNLQRVLGAIDRACRTDPSPDLVVLPGGCDTGGPLPGGEFPLSIIQNVREAIALKAREWGIYIAVGLHARCPDGYRHSAVLFDPDADVVAMHEAGDECAAEGCRDVRWCCSVGDIEVRAVEGLVEVSSLERVPSCGLVVAAPLPAHTDVKPTATGAYWAIVRSAGPASRRSKTAAPTSRFVNPDGKEGPAADPVKEDVVVSSVAVRPATPSERMGRRLAANGNA